MADSLGVPIVKVSDHLGWRQEADRLTAAAETILADGERYGPHLDNMETGRVRMEGELSRLRHVIREDGEYASKVKKPDSCTVNPQIHGRTVEQPEPAKPDWYAQLTKPCGRTGTALIEDARQAGIPSFYAKGYMDMIPRIRGLMENPDIPAKSRAPLIQVLENHQRYLSTRKHILDYPGEAERHMEARASLQDVAADREIELTGVPAHPDWRQEAERLTAAGEAMLADRETHGAHLARIVEARTHMIRALSDLGEAIRGDDKELAEREAPELRRRRFRHLAGPRFASDGGAGPDPARDMSTGAAPVRAALSRFGRAIGHLVGGRGYHDRLRTATFAREALERSEELKRDWKPPSGSRRGEGRPCHLHGWLRPSAQGARHHRRRHAPGSRRQIGDKRRTRLNSARSCQTATISTTGRELMAGQMDRREALAAKAAERGVAVPDHEDYDTWRNVTDFAVGRCEGTHGRPGAITASTSIAPRSEKRASGRHSRGCATCLKTTTGTSRQPLAGQRAGEEHPDARGAHRPSARRSGEAPGVAPTARRAQGRQAAEQGPAHEHANVGRRPITDLRALLADRWRHLRVGLR